jgi:hypothetical protein
MRIEKITSCYYVFQIQNFEQKKHGILNTVTKNLKKQSKFINGQEVKQKNDFFSANTYTNSVINILSSVLEEFRKYKSKEEGRELDLKILNLWCQQYELGSQHPWHTHGNSDYSAVFFIDIPNNNTTEFLDGDNKIVKANAKEGDLIIFPSQMIHRSKINNFKESKTIVSFNMTLY